MEVGIGPGRAFLRCCKIWVAGISAGRRVGQTSDKFRASLKRVLPGRETTLATRFSAKTKRAKEYVTAT
jgi:hypothetical protein